MIGDIKASLYDFFGYLFPGIVALVALILAIGSAADRIEVFSLLPLSNGVVLATFFFVSYLLGHVCQALGNRVLPRPEESCCDWNSKAQSRLPTSIINQIDAAIPKVFAVNDACLKSTTKFGLIDEARFLAEREGDREMYIYRVGFYRAMVVAFGLLTVSTFILWLGQPICFQWAESVVAPCLRGWDLGILAVASGASAYASYLRFRRFSEYKIERAAYLFLAIAANKPAAGTASAP